MTDVSAQSPSTTPTWVPLFPSTTPIPIENNTCPGYQPMGVGTVTPSAKWMMSCGMCVTPDAADWPTLQPTEEFIMPTYDPTYFPTESSMERTMTAGIPTSTFVPTGTSAVTSTPQINHFYLGDPVTLTGMGKTDDGDPILSGNIWAVDQVRGFIVTNRNMGGINYDGQRLGMWWASWHQEVDWGRGTNDYCGIKGISGLTDNQICQQLTGLNSSHADPGVIASGQYFYFKMQAYGNEGDLVGVSYTATFWPVYYGTHEELVTPTPVPTSLSYCDEIESIGGGVDPDDPVLPRPEVGPSQCVQIGGFTINLTWVSSLGQLAGISIPTDIGLPGINICFAPIKFGTLQMFGLSFDLDTLSAVMSAIAAIFLFLRS